MKYRLIPCDAVASPSNFRWEGYVLIEFAGGPLVFTQHDRIEASAWLLSPCCRRGVLRHYAENGEEFFGCSACSSKLSGVVGPTHTINSDPLPEIFEAWFLPYTDPLSALVKAETLLSLIHAINEKLPPPGRHLLKSSEVSAALEELARY